VTSQCGRLTTTGATFDNLDVEMPFTVCPPVSFCLLNLIDNAKKDAFYLNVAVLNNIVVSVPDFDTGTVVLA